MGRGRMRYEEQQAYAVVLGKVVAFLRQRREWTQGHLAQMVGVQQSAISRIESGAMLPDAFTFRRIADAFDMAADTLQQKVDAAYERTRVTVNNTTATTGDGPWWQMALGIAGIVGLAGLAIFAVASIFAEEERDRR